MEQFTDFFKGEIIAKPKHFWRTIAQNIKEDIINGVYEPLERIKESDLAKKYDVSKTPIREALRYLEGIGFLEIIPHTMVRVTEMNKKEVHDLYRIQCVLEGLGIEEALPNLDQKDYEEMDLCATLMEKYVQKEDYSNYSKSNHHFHFIIWKASNNQRLFEILVNTHERIERFHVVPRKFPERFKTLVKDHRKIIKALMNKDSEKARSLIMDHVQKQEKLITELINEKNRV